MSDDRVWDAIADGILGRSQRRVPSGWINICCPCCISRGETQDRKYRCGILHVGAITKIKCFNCGFMTGWQICKPLNRAMKDFLRQLGISDKQISLLAYWAEQMRRQIEHNPELQQKLDIAGMPSFPTISLPPSARPLKELADEGCDDPNFLAVAAYVLSRGDVAATASVYYWTPRNNLHRRLIIPCYYEEQIVGWIAREINGRTPRYLKELPPNYLFNAKYLTGRRHYALIVEGAFDALALDAIGVLGASLNDRQIAWINQSGKQPIVVPDRDKAGCRLVELAIDQGWGVATPYVGRRQWWDADIKDAAEAVQRYGKLYVVQSVLATQEYDPVKIQLSMQYLVR